MTVTRRPQVCPQCRRPFPPPLAVSGPIRQRLVDLLINSPDGIAVRELVGLVYDDPNGGPLTAQRSLNVIAHRANKELRRQGFQITSTWRGRGAKYQLVALAERGRHA
jgi:hypothetical protein